MGTVKNNRIKVKDGVTGDEFWRQSKKGFMRDSSGEPISIKYDKVKARQRRKHVPHSGKREKAYVGSGEE